MAGSSPPGSVRPTGARPLALAAILGGLLGWGIVRVATAFDKTPPQVPWSAPLALALAALFVGYLAWTTHAGLQKRRERVDASRAVALLVLGKSAALAGAAVAAGYLGFALNFVARLDVTDPRERVIRSGVALVAGVALAVAGVLLERACRVPEDPDSDEAPGPSAPPSRA